MSFQRRGDLQALWIVPCCARTLLFLLEKLWSYTIKQNNKKIVILEKLKRQSDYVMDVSRRKHEQLGQELSFY